MQIKRVLYILNLLITKNNLKVSISSSKGGVVLIKSEGMLKGIRKGSINSADTSLLMMNQLAKDIKELKIKEMCIYVHGATR
jgi:ribosomal protein S11